MSLSEMGTTNTLFGLTVTLNLAFIPKQFQYNLSENINYSPAPPLPYQRRTKSPPLTKAYAVLGKLNRFVSSTSHRYLLLVGSVAFSLIFLYHDDVSMALVTYF